MVSELKRVCVSKKGDNVSENELREFCEGLIGAYKTPDHIYFLDDLPKGPSGKVQRMKLVDLTLLRKAFLNELNDLCRSTLRRKITKKDYDELLFQLN